MNCKDCKFWSGNEYEFCGLKQCCSPKKKEGYHVQAEEIDANGVLVEDDEGWGMMTGPMFGCVNFSKKENV